MPGCQTPSYAFQEWKVDTKRQELPMLPEVDKTKESNKTCIRPATNSNLPSKNHADDGQMWKG
jgi:hypothetical protein